MAKISFFAVGSYNKSPSPAKKPGKEGITIFALDQETGFMERIANNPMIINPSYLHYCKNSNLLICNSEIENEKSDIYVLKFDRQIKNKFLYTKIPGKAKCHILCNKDESIIISCAYGDGKVNAIPIAKNSLLPQPECYQLIGHSINKKRQEQAHAHQALFLPNNKNILITDLGSDMIWNIDLKSNKVSPFWGAPLGTGPRHMVLNNNLLYILCELKPLLFVLNIKEKEPKLAQIINTSKIYKNEMISSAAIKIHPSGKTLAVSNRKINSISIFKINDSGLLKLEKEFNSKGGTPRDIAFSQDGQWLLIANQDTNCIIARKFDIETGFPTSAWGGKSYIGTPACICII